MFSHSNKRPNMKQEALLSWYVITVQMSWFLNININDQIVYQKKKKNGIMFLFILRVLICWETVENIPQNPRPGMFIQGLTLHGWRANLATLTGCTCLQICRLPGAKGVLRRRWRTQLSSGKLPTFWNLTVLGDALGAQLAQRAGHWWCWPQLSIKTLYGL